MNGQELLLTGMHQTRAVCHVQYRGLLPLHLAVRWRGEKHQASSKGLEGVARWRRAEIASGCKFKTLIGHIVVRRGGEDNRLTMESGMNIGMVICRSPDSKIQLTSLQS